MKKCPKGKVFNRKTNRCRKRKQTIKFKKNSKLTKREKRYCKCLFYLKTKKIANKYALCTNSVYNLQGVKRTKVVPCTENYSRKIK